jgi:hypothetical protein
MVDIVFIEIALMTGCRPSTSLGAQLAGNPLGSQAIFSRSLRVALQTPVRWMDMIFNCPLRWREFSTAGQT